MAFFHKNKVAINVVLSVSIVLDLVSAFIINKISTESFDFLAPHNIVLCAILIVLVIALIICKLIEYNTSPAKKIKKLQKAFFDNGGYDVVVDEMKNCIKTHDLKTMKELKKMVDIIER